MTCNIDFLAGVTRPARYTGGEWNSITKDWGQVSLRVAIAFPEPYELGMSNLAVGILYDLLNRQPDVLAERVFAPWQDMETQLRKRGLPLFSLETRHSLSEFDIVGFSLEYELSYTNVLTMLDLGQIPLLARERNETHPLVIGGGSCTMSPEPLADFFDLFVVGEAEAIVPGLLTVYRRWQAEREGGREGLLKQLAQVAGIYVPGFYRDTYLPDGRLESLSPTVAEASPVIERQLAEVLPEPVTKPIVPYLSVVHDRATIELQRGCSRGCRFCQAGIIYRPVRERTPEEVLSAVEETIANCGYNEVSLLSLSTSDYPGIDHLISALITRFPKLAVSLPSLRLDSFSVALADKLVSRKRGGLTFAPEAGTERMRRVINKNLTEEQILAAAAAAFERGWNGLKLYFMMGLPTETMEDVEGIISLTKEISATGRRVKGRQQPLRINLSALIPKPHTPFQWVGQTSGAELNARYEKVCGNLNRKQVKISWNDTAASQLEAVMSRGDRRLGKVIRRAWELGARFDAWSDLFNYPLWKQAFEETGLSPEFYANRERTRDERLPWGHIESGVSADYLWQEYQRALEATPTPDCRTASCNACGMEQRPGGCPRAGQTEKA